MDTNRVDKTIDTTGSHTRLNIVGAIRLRHLEDKVSTQYKTVKGESTIDFFDVTLPNIRNTLDSRFNDNFQTFKFSS